MSPTKNYIRNQITENFTQVPNELIDDNTISWKAKGIFAYLLSKPDDWEFYMNEIKQNATEGRVALQSGIKELEEAGWLKRERRHDEYGEFAGYDWVLINRQAGYPSDGLTDSRETCSHTKTNSTNTNNTNTKDNYSQFLDLWNEVHDTQLRMTTSKRKQIKARLRRFSEGELKQAIRNRGSDEWIRANGHANKWDALFRNDEKVDHWLNRENNVASESGNGYVVRAG